MSKQAPKLLLAGWFMLEIVLDLHDDAEGITGAICIFQV